MDILLSDVEVRVLGSLVEKSIATPEYYPLTLNALVNACNQRSNREPVVNYDDNTVARALEGLREKELAGRASGAARVPRYEHYFDESLGLTPEETAIMCELMIRGAQTAGELRSRADRLYPFPDIAEVERVLVGLMNRDEESLVIKLPVQPGRKEPRYAHLLSGEPVLPEANGPRPERAMLEVMAENERMARLENEVQSLREELESLRQEFTELKELLL